MDSTPTQRLTFKIAPTKLPIKRKSPDDHRSNPHPHPSPHPHPLPNPNPNPNLDSKFETAAFNTNHEEDDPLDDDTKPPPFKFHRIWTEPDEIRFLQGLLNCFSEGLIFPRDLQIFYNRFTQSTTQPYTKSQLSEKLRRLRKKFRVISSRIDRGLDASRLSPHDQSLFHLSQQLWHPDYSSSSPFNANASNKNKSDGGGGVRVKVTFNPTFTPPPSLPVTSITAIPSFQEIDNGNCLEIANENDDDEQFDAGNGEELNLPNVGEELNLPNRGEELNLPNVGEELNLPNRREELNFPKRGEEPNGASGRDDNSGEIRKIVAKAVMDVFENSLKEVRSVYSTPTGSSQQGKVDDFMTRCREQRLLELDVFANRLRARNFAYIPP